MQMLDEIYPENKPSLPVIMNEILFLNDFVCDDRFTENVRSLGKTNSHEISLKFHYRIF